MDNIYFARIKEIHFKNFRNIEEGSIDFPNSKFNEFLLEENPSILGLYGQNGSGKTSVIMAIELLKDVISGKQIDKRYLSCIKKGSDRFTLDFVFSMYSRKMDDNDIFVEGSELADCYDVYYSFDIAKQSESSSEEDLLNETKGKDDYEEKIRIENEVFSYRNIKLSGEIISQKHIFLNTSSESDDKNLLFGSERKLKEYFGQNNEFIEQLKLNKYLAYENSKSFVFSVRVQDLISKAYTKKHNPKLAEDYERIIAFRKEQVEAAKKMDNEKLINPPDEYEIKTIREYFDYSNGFVPLELIENLFLFGSSYLYVINTATTGLININSELPLLLWTNDDGMPYKKVLINMDKPTKIPVDKFDSISKSLSCLNMVLEKMIPGMKLLIENQTILLSEENAKEYSFEILSSRENTVIPLKYESDGVRRLVSILSLLIAAYNEASFTIAIDEIDSGIFEYLLGELLSVFSDSSKGQLIFTSHNLRPLEVLPAKYLCFTTTNPNNRFIKIANRGNSNLRDGYFRSIILDTQKEQVYKPTNKYDIQAAFYRAGHGEE